MTYGGSNDDVINDITWPWKVKVMIPVSLRPVISKKARDRVSVTMGHLLEMARVVSNGRVIDDVTWPRKGNVMTEIIFECIISNMA